MQPTDILQDEHRIIEQVLNCLEKILDRCAAEKKLDQESAQQALDFFCGFAEQCHHKKEEAQLFPLMEANGFPGECSPVTVVRREHELGRLYVQSMENTIEAAAAGNAEALKQFVQHGQGYLKMLREHIDKEDTCLFPAANHHFTQQDQEKLLTALQKIEADHQEQGLYGQYTRLANDLADRLGVPRVTATAAVASCPACGGH